MDTADTPVRGSFRPRPWVLVLAAVIVIALVVVFTQNGAGKGHHGGTGSAANGSTGSGSSNGKKGGSSGSHPKTFSVDSSTPAQGAQNVASDSNIVLNFSTPVTIGSVKPTLNPPVAGTWQQTSRTSWTYDTDAPLTPGATEAVTLPSGSSGIRSDGGGVLQSGSSFQFMVAVGDYTRLQQILADLNYLPVSFAPSGAAPAPKELAEPQPGTFNFRWANQPAELTSQWTPGQFDEITRAAVESFENQNNLTVDGIAGPEVWTSLLAALTANKVDDVPYVYVLVTKVQPENLTLYNNGAVDLSGILINSGAPGADTTDGTYAVFEHVRYSDMQGTNPDGSKYNDPNVPYASYFNGGDALHGFIRAQYGYPQSNGCIEMSYANAAQVWPLTPIGTLVTIEGPASGPGPTTTTTTTTTAPPATTTTTAPPAATTTTAPPAG